MSFAIVTGGGRGIGRATALALAARGLDVVVFGRTQGDLERTAELVAAHGRRALGLCCDVSRADDVEMAAREVARVFGTPRVVVNNAGVVRRALVQDTTEEDWDAVVDVNLKGTFLVTRAFLPAMRDEGAGRFVAIASISATLGSPRLGAYCAAKWGIVGFTKSLAEELRGTGLQALVVLPGSVDTEMLKGSGFEPQMTAGQVADVVAYAGLDAPDAMNGSALEVFGP